MKVVERLKQIGMLAVLAQAPANVPITPVPLVGATDIGGLFRKIIGWLLFIAGAVAVIYLIWGGFMYLTAGGDAERANKAKTTIINAVIGIVIIALAYAIYRAVISALG